MSRPSAPPAGAVPTVLNGAAPAKKQPKRIGNQQSAPNGILPMSDKLG